MLEFFIVREIKALRVRAHIYLQVIVDSRQFPGQVPAVFLVRFWKCRRIREKSTLHWPEEELHFQASA